jgi:hypothetical protein
MATVCGWFDLKTT